MKENSVRMYPYGGYDPFSTPSAKAFSQSSGMPDRPPYTHAPTTPFSPYPQQYTQAFMPYMPPMMPPGAMAHPMMQGMGMPFMQHHGQGKQNPMGMYPNNQHGSGMTFGKAMGGANQLMGLAQQMGSIISLFK